MPQPFTRTLRSLERDGAGRQLAGLALAAVLLAAWGAWFFLARLSVYALSSDARIEVESAAHPVAAAVTARVAAVRVALGDEVAAGQVLLELDVGAVASQLTAERRRLDAFGESREAIAGEIRSTLDQRRAAQRSMDAGLAETAARQREGRAAARQADADRERFELLAGEGLASTSEVEHARSEAEQRWAAVEALELGAARLRADYERRDRELAARLDQLHQEKAGLDEQSAATEARVATLEHELGERVLRAPVAGRIGQLADLRPGTMATAGERLATVVPAGRPRVVAFFAPAEAFGRIRPGQRGRLRLTGFPALQYGSLAAAVHEVAAELGDGRVRVELDLAGDAPPGIPLEHGLPGVVEVEVERASPAVLMLRAAGRAVDRRSAPDG